MQNNHFIQAKYFAIVLLFTMQFSQAQGVWDMLNNQSYEFNNYVKKQVFDKNYLSGTLEITHFCFKDKAKELYPELNQKIFSTCINSLEDELKYRAIFQKALDKLEILTEIVNSRNRRSYDDDLGKLNPKLYHIEIEVVSVIGNKVCYEFNYQFELPSREVDKIEVKEYYWGDLMTTSVVKMDKKPTASQIKSIEDKVFKPLNEHFLLATQNLNLADLEDYNEELEERPVSKPLENQGNVYHKIQLKDADFLWMNHGIVIQIQDLASTTSTIQGKGMYYFIPYREALAYLKWIPELAFIAQLPEVKTTIRNWNDPNVIVSKFYNIKSEPSLLEWVQNKNQKQKIKKLEQASFQISKNGERRKMNRNVYEFDGNQKLLWHETFDDQDKTYSKTFYDYDAKGNLILKTVKLKTKKEVINQYFYDAQGNLIRQRNNESDEISETHYFYNQNTVYSFSYQMFDEWPYHRTHLSFHKDKFCTDNVCYLLNQNGDVVGVQSEKYTHYQAQIGRNEQGILQEAHFDNDRYHYYFDYSENQLLTDYKVYEYAIPKNHIQWFYENDSSIPYKISKLSTSYDTILIEEEISWEGF